MAGAGGGAWKVAYADFVTAMMAFFMVMWLTAQKPDVKQAVAGYFRDPYAIFKGNEPGNAVDASPVEDPKLGHAAQSQRRRVSNSGNDANYQFTVPFQDGVAELDAGALQQIRSFAPTMVGKLNRVEIRAHCLSQALPEGSPFKDRWDLCYARGRAVQSALEDEGVDAERIRLSQAEANEPMAANLTNEELELNSRVDVILLDDLIATPWRAKHTASDEHGDTGHGSGTPHGNPAASSDHGAEAISDGHAAPVDHGAH
jgi:chemotaxis protein MotB